VVSGEKVCIDINKVGENPITILILQFDLGQLTIKQNKKLHNTLQPSKSTRYFLDAQANQ
jgi:hypothetical protein